MKELIRWGPSICNFPKKKAVKNIIPRDGFCRFINGSANISNGILLTNVTFADINIYIYILY